MAIIKLVSFDIGNTLIWSNDDGFCQNFQRACGKSREELRPLFIEQFLTKNQPMETAVRIVSDTIGFADYTAFLRNYKKPKVHIFADALPALKKILETGIPLVAISNCTPWEQGNLDQFGLLDYLSCVFYSFSLGAAKPDPKIFQHAQRVFNVAANEILHIGDSWDADIEGALACGWHAVYLNRNEMPERSDNKAPAVKTLDEVSDLVVQMI